MKKLTFFILIALIMSAFTYKPKRIVFIGDSITDGNWGNSKYWNQPCDQRDQNDMNHIYGHGFMYITASRMQAENPDDYLFFNRGISGNRLCDIALRWNNDLINLQPDEIHILVGVNDLIQSDVADTIKWENTYDSLISITKTKFPDIKIIIGQPFCFPGHWFKDFQRKKLECESLSRIAERVARKHKACFVKYWDMLKKLEASNPEKYIWDGVHPTPAGHYKMAELLKKQI